MASGCVTKVISNFFKEIFLVFSIILGNVTEWVQVVIIYSEVDIIKLYT